MKRSLQHSADLYQPKQIAAKTKKMGYFEGRGEEGRGGGGGTGELGRGEWDWEGQWGLL